MIPRECKRLIEVDFPLGLVSKYAAKEKSIRHGHPSTLHLWWARRPLASCRAVLLGLLLPDPCDPQCPPEFNRKARELLGQVPGETMGLAGRKPGKDENPEASLRKALLHFIGEFASWDLANYPTYIQVARALIKAAHPEETPLVVDPFAGGGSIPLEALRLGCEAFASDLNPVACLILKVMLEDIPRHGAPLAQELRRVGAEIKAAAEQELADFYPPDPDGAQPIAYLWARTVRCEAPHCGAEIPLMRSFWLCKKASRKWALRYKVARPQGEPPRVEFEVFDPKTDKEVHGGTVTRAKATCLCCSHAVLPPERVRAQLAERKGGADVIFDMKGNRTGGARLLAVVTLRPGEQGRHYRLPTVSDYQAVWKAQQRLKDVLDKWEKSGRKDLCPVPDEPLPPEREKGSSGFRVLLYGMRTFGDLFSIRQKVAMLTLAEQASSVDQESLAPLLAFAISKQSDFNSSLSRWANHMEKSVATFGRQALPMLWDWGEVVPTSSSSGAFTVALDWIANASETVQAMLPRTGQVEIADACESPLPDETAAIWFTDPPYYDAVAYADLSDFFFVWLKRSLPHSKILRDPFDSDNILTPKGREAIQDPHRIAYGAPKGREFYEDKVAGAFREGCRVLRKDGIGSVVFAHKTTEGWEALLSGMIQGGLTITAAWPIATEKPQRMIAQDSAALATSVHLVCRPRSPEAGVGDWSEVKAEMDQKVRAWMERLIKEGIRGADAIFACIGPALEVYSRYTSVETPAGHPVPLGGDPDADEPQERGFLAYIFETVSRVALRQVLGDADTEGFEEDARLTALFLWTLQSSRINGNNLPNGAPAEAAEEAGEPDEGEDEEKPKKAKGGLALPFDVFIRLTRPMGIHYQNWQGRIIDIEKGIVQLVAVADRKEALLEEDVELQPVAWTRRSPQRTLFEMPEPAAPAVTRRRSGPVLENLTTLDRLHRAMLLFAGGQTLSLRRLLDEERLSGRRFERLAFSLTALYPPKSQERRWLEGLQGMMKMR